MSSVEQAWKDQLADYARKNNIQSTPQLSAIGKAAFEYEKSRLSTTEDRTYEKMFAAMNKHGAAECVNKLQRIVEVEPEEVFAFAPQNVADAYRRSVRLLQIEFFKNWADVIGKEAFARGIAKLVAMGAISQADVDAMVTEMDGGVLRIPKFFV